MPIRATHAAKNGILETGLDALLNSAILEIRSGTQPALARNIPTGTVLWTETLPADAFAAAVNGQKAKNGTWQANGVANGPATWFRFRLASDTGVDTENQVRIDGSVTITGGGGDLTLTNVNIAVGQSVEVVTCVVSL
jgi:hypothetical protein